MMKKRTGYWLGKKHTEGYKKNMSLSCSDKIVSEKTKEKLRTYYVKKNPIDIDYFKHLNKRNAYVLGYLFADGCLWKRRNRVNGRNLSFHSIDKELINKIKKEFKILHRKTKVIKDYRNGRYSYCITICNYYFIKYLIEQGMLAGKKSDRIFVPDAIKKDNELFFAFFRGFFDGDGSINSIKYAVTPRCKITTASKKLLIQIKNLMNVYKIITKPIESYENQKCFALHFDGWVNTYNLYKLMYKNSDSLFLIRKKKRFEEFFHKRDLAILSNRGNFKK